MEIKVGVSNRHIHLSKDVLEILFGTNYELSVLKPITQTNQFGANEVVSIKGSKGQINKVRVLGPLREYTQVEISRSDAYTLGVNPPLRNSGDLDNSESLTIIGPNGEITLDNCCIIAKRHIHMSCEEAISFGVENKSEVSVKFNTHRGAVLENFSLKVGPLDVLEIHIDTDEANCMDIKTGDIGYLIKN